MQLLAWGLLLLQPPWPALLCALPRCPAQKAKGMLATMERKGVPGVEQLVSAGSAGCWFCFVPQLGAAA